MLVSLARIAHTGTILRVVVPATTPMTTTMTTSLDLRRSQKTERNSKKMLALPSSTRVLSNTVSTIRVNRAVRRFPAPARSARNRTQVDRDRPIMGTRCSTTAVSATPDAVSPSTPAVNTNGRIGGKVKTLALAGVACAVLLAAPSVAQAAATAAPAEPSSLVSLIKSSVSFVLHLDVHLGDIVSKYGMATYAILFAIVFAETGLVVTPLLPGDSLLFATGALAALGKLNIVALLALYAVAAILGDAVNYAVGKSLGSKAVDAKLVKKAYLDKTEKFYEKYGPKTIVLARFVPIVRTFAPFVAGVGRMAYQQFAVYNVLGALLWVGICTFAGYCFGNIPMIHENFSLVVLGIILVSVLPVVFELLMAHRNGGRHGGRSGSVARVGGSLVVRFT